MSLKEAMIAIFGEYEPITVTVIENELSKQVICVDWSYILTVGIFIIVLASALKMIGGIICAK